MNITDKIQFEPTHPLSKQSDDFKAWYNENIGSKINDKTPNDGFDAYKRPISYTVIFEGFKTQITPQYIFQDSSNWSCSDFKIEMEVING
mgnify:CR=1 FL=1